MNQKNLSIAIIVVAAIVIVIGLWLSGAGQSGPLSGDVNYNYCVDTQLKADCYLGMVRTEIWGTLKTSSGTPLQSQRLTVWWYEESSDTWWYWFDMTTGADGTFKVTKSTAVTYPPRIIYEDGEINGIRYCDAWVDCTPSIGVKL